MIRYVTEKLDYLLRFDAFDAANLDLKQRYS
jgi:hypothetical protein